jgi:hypothetical protein
MRLKELERLANAAAAGPILIQECPPI